MKIKRKKVRMEDENVFKINFYLIAFSFLSLSERSQKKEGSVRSFKRKKGQEIEHMLPSSFLLSLNKLKEKE